MDRFVPEFLAIHSEITGGAEDVTLDGKMQLDVDVQKLAVRQDGAMSIIMPLSANAGRERDGQGGQGRRVDD